MTTAQHRDQDVEETLQRAAAYLSRRGTEYFESPIQPAKGFSAGPSRYQRLLIGVVAAAVLGAVALIGSFIGGPSSRNVNIARAAWSETPAVLSESAQKEAESRCRPMVEEFWSAKGLQTDDVSPIVDYRGSTTMILYVADDQSVLCFDFADGSLMAQRVDIFTSVPGSNGSTLTALAVMVDGKEVGLVFGSLPHGTDGKTTVKVHQEGRAKAIDATVARSGSRYVAWSPSTEAVTVEFTDSSTQVTASVGPMPFIPPCLGACAGGPTSVPG